MYVLWPNFHTLNIVDKPLFLLFLMIVYSYETLNNEINKYIISIIIAFSTF